MREVIYTVAFFMAAILIGYSVELFLIKMGISESPFPYPYNKYITALVFTLVFHFRAKLRNQNRKLPNNHE